MNTFEIAQKYALEFTLEDTTRCTYEEVFEACELSCKDTENKAIEMSGKYIRKFLQGFFNEGILDGIIRDYERYMKSEI